MEKLRIGVLGVSNHFIKRIALPLQKTSYCCIYAIASRQRLKAEEIAANFNIPLVCNNYEELISNPEVDAIYNPLPNHLHAEWTIKALEQGKPVLCEKPFGMNETEAKKMADVSNITGIPVMEAFMYKFHPMWKHVRNLVKTNHIGNISYIHTSFSYNNPSETNIRNNKDFGGGALMDIGCYAISVPRFLLDKEPLRVLAQSVTHPDFGTDMHTSGLLDFGSARASFHVSTMSEPFQKVDIVGTAGSITVHIPFNTYVDVPSIITVNTGQGSRDIIIPVSDAYVLMFEAFAKSVTEGDKMPYPLSDAIGNMNVIDAIRKSAEIGNWVNIAD